MSDQSPRRPDATWSDEVRLAVANATERAAMAGRERYGLVELTIALMDYDDIRELFAEIGINVAMLRHHFIEQAAESAPATSRRGKTTDPVPDERTIVALVRAGDMAHERRSSDRIELIDVMAAIVTIEAELPEEERSYPARRLIGADLNADALYEVAEPELEHSHQHHGHAGHDEEAPSTAGFTEDLTEIARAGKLDPLIGREREINEIISVLSRRSKNNPVLIGEPGTGKTALAEGIAARIVEGRVPAKLKEARVIALSPGRMVANTVYRGQFEARVSALIDELKSKPNTILFIDELHAIIGAGASSSTESGDIATMLKPALARGELRCIGATTREEYRRFIERDPALERRFTPIELHEPSAAETVTIITGLAPRYAAHHGISYLPEAIEACVAIAERHLLSRRFPDKAVDLMDEAGARAAIAGKAEVGPDDVQAAIEARLGTPIDGEADRDPAAAIGARLRERIAGNQEAIAAISRLIAARRTGLVERSGAIATLLITGPAGAGKSELTAAIAELLFEGRRTTIDGTLIADSSAAWSLIGVPTGYTGADAPARLVDPLRHAPSQLVVIDRAESLHPSAVEIIAEALRSGSVRDQRGRSVSLRSAIVVFLVGEIGRSTIGFNADAAVIRRGRIEKATEAIGAIGELVDLAVAIDPIAIDDLTRIATDAIGAMVSAAAVRGCIVTVDPAVVPTIAARAAKAGGVRGLRRIVAAEVEPAIAEIAWATATNGTINVEGERIVAAFTASARRRSSSAPKRATRKRA
jgi:ATP-dependent Clp protease ATP-binding subunit ClpC